MTLGGFYFWLISPLSEEKSPFEKNKNRGVSPLFFSKVKFPF